MNKYVGLRNFASLLNKKQRSSFIGLLLFGIICSIFELFSLLIINPVFQILLKSKSINSYDLLFYFNDFTHKFIEHNLVLFILSLLFSIFILKLILSYFYNWNQSVFVSNFESSISTKVYKSFVSKEYEYYLNNNSSKLITTLTHEVELFSNSINSFLVLILELSIIAGAFIALLILEFYGTIIVTVFLFFTILIFNIFQKKLLRNLSLLRFKYINEKYIILNQTFKNIKDVKIFGIENFLIHHFDSATINGNNVKKKISYIGTLPRNFLEIAILAAVSIIFFYFSLKYKDVNLIIPIFSIYILALFRILPSLNKVLISIQQIRTSKNAINSIYHVLKNYEFSQKLELPEKYIFNFNNSIEINNLNFKYNSVDKNIFTNLNLFIKKGMKIGIVGESGAGKTTFVDLLLGLLTPTSGSISVDGINISNYLKMWQNKIGYVQQSIFLSDTSIKENIAYGIAKELIDENKVLHAISIANINKLINDLPDGINTTIGENGIKLSGGQRQRIAIARAIYKSPEILIFDEATSALDLINEEEIINSIYSLNYNSTMIIISHKLSILKNCDIILQITNGDIKEYKA